MTSERVWADTSRPVVLPTARQRDLEVADPSPHPAGPLPGGRHEGRGRREPGNAKEAGDAPGRLVPSILERYEGTSAPFSSLWDVQTDDGPNRERRPV